MSTSASLSFTEQDTGFDLGEHKKIYQGDSGFDAWAIRTRERDHGQVADSCRYSTDIRVHKIKPI